MCRSRRATRFSPKSPTEVCVTQSIRSVLFRFSDVRKVPLRVHRLLLPATASPQSSHLKSSEKQRKSQRAAFRSTPSITVRTCVTSASLLSTAPNPRTSTTLYPSKKPKKAICSESTSLMSRTMSRVTVLSTRRLSTEEQASTMRTRSSLCYPKSFQTASARLTPTRTDSPSQLSLSSAPTAK